MLGSQSAFNLLLKQSLEKGSTKSHAKGLKAVSKLKCSIIIKKLNLSINIILLYGGAPKILIKKIHFSVQFTYCF